MARYRRNSPGFVQLEFDADALSTLAYFCMERYLKTLERLLTCAPVPPSENDWWQHAYVAVEELEAIKPALIELGQARKKLLHKRYEV